MRLMGHSGHRLPRKVVDTSYLKVFKIRFDEALSDLVEQVSLPTTRGLELVDL